MPIIVTILFLKLLRTNTSVENGFNLVATIANGKDPDIHKKIYVNATRLG